jgi:acetyl-CoA carboxylase carboxyl transferase subunit beta
MSWLKRENTRPQGGGSRELPDGLWVKCEGCGEILYFKELERNLHVCPKCGFHFRIGARRYTEILLDEGSFREADAGVVSVDPLGFKDSKRYTDRLADARRKTGLGEAILTGTGTLEGLPVVLGAMDFSFIGGSMASAVGEKIARAARRSLEKRMPLILVSASGGARMMEGILSLMQMAKTSVLLARMADLRIPYISILTDPTTGGVTASFAQLGDVILAEPGALIGFAGPRVIRETVAQELPPGFQRSEFLLEHGFVDRIVPRSELRSTTARILKNFADGLRSEPGRALAEAAPSPAEPRKAGGGNGVPPDPGPRGPDGAGSVAEADVDSHSRES